MPLKRRTCQWCLGQKVFPDLDQLVGHIRTEHMESLDPPKYHPIPVALPEPEEDEIPQGQEGDW